MNTVFIYALCEPGTRTVRYIGYSNNPKKRLRSHLSRKLNTPVGKWMSDLSERPNLVVLSEVSVNGRKSEECRYIAAARSLGLNLLNVNEGGGGVVTHTPEARAAIGAASRGENNPNYGMSPTKETREKMRQARLGKTMPQEVCAKISVKISALKTGVKLPPEHCANIGKSKLGIKPSGETKALMSMAQLERWRLMPTEERERLSALARLRVDSDETRARKSAAAILRESLKRQKKEGAVV